MGSEAMIKAPRMQAVELPQACKAGMLTCCSPILLVQHCLWTATQPRPLTRCGVRVRQQIRLLLPGGCPTMASFGPCAAPQRRQRGPACNWFHCYCRVVQWLHQGLACLRQCCRTWATVQRQQQGASCRRERRPARHCGESSRRSAGWRGALRLIAGEHGVRRDRGNPSRATRRRALSTQMVSASFHRLT